MSGITEMMKNEQKIDAHIFSSELLKMKFSFGRKELISVSIIDLLAKLCQD